MKKLLVRMARQSPALIVAMLALFVALTGTAVATTSALIGSAQIRNNSITGLDVKNRSLRPIDFRGSVRGPRGLRGLTGATGGTGATGAKGDKGDKGDTGPVPGTLPAGTTLRGNWVLLDAEPIAGEEHQIAIPYYFKLSSVPTKHFIAVGAVPPSECPGSATNPQAQAGHACFYESHTQNNNGRSVQDLNDGTVGTRLVATSTVVATTTYSFGSWAVTGQ